MFILLLLFDFDFETAISLYATILAIIVIFGSSMLSNVMDGIRLIFGISPFNVGDIIIYNNIRYKVNKINILSCEFICKGSIVYFNNTTLVNNIDNLVNYSRGYNPSHGIDIWVDQNTTNEEINQIKRLFENYINKNMSADIKDIWFVINSIDKQGNVQLSAWVTSTIAFGQEEIRWKQHCQLYYALRDILQKLNIKYKFPDVNFLNKPNNDCTTS